MPHSTSSHGIRGQKKAPLARGSWSALHDPVCVAVSSGRVRAKVRCGKSPLLHSGVSRLHGLNFHPGWNVGARFPGRTSRPACSFTPSLVPDSPQMVWPPLPVPASTAPSFFPCSSNACHLCASRITREGRNLVRSQANPVPVHGCHAKTGTCRTLPECDGEKVYRVPTYLSCRLLTTAAPILHTFSHTEKRAPARSGRSSARAKPPWNSAISFTM